MIKLQFYRCFLANLNQYCIYPAKNHSVRIHFNKTTQVASNLPKFKLKTGVLHLAVQKYSVAPSKL